MVVGTDILGLDLGGVLITDLDSPPNPVVMEQVKNWDGKIVIISFAGTVMQQKSQDWLDKWGITWDVYFVRHKLDKAVVARALGVTMYVDDQQVVLDSMVTVPNKIWMQTPDVWIDLRK